MQGSDAPGVDRSTQAASLHAQYAGVQSVLHGHEQAQGPRTGGPPPAGKKTGKKPQRGKQSSVYLGFNGGGAGGAGSTAA